MMNKIYFFLLWLATAAAGMALSACSKSNDYVYVDDDDEPDKATVSVVAEDGTVSLLVPQSTIGLFVIDEGGNVTYREVVVDANGKIVLPEGADASSLILYSPCQAEWGRDALYTPQRFQVQENQSTEKGYQASDLLVAVRGTSAGTRSSDISLSFRHMMARMVIHIVDEVGSTDFSSVSMRLLGMNNSVDVSLATQSVSTVPESVADIGMLAYAETDRRLSLCAIVAPQTREPTDNFIEFSHYGSHRLYGIPQTAELQAGMTYTYQMRLTESGLIPDGTFISNWDDDGSDAYFNIKTHR